MSQPAVNTIRRVRASAAAPHLALIAVQLLFGSWPIVGKLALQAVPSLGLVAIRVGGASLAFLLLGRITTGIGRIRREHWPLLVISSFLGVVFNQWLFVKGLSLTTAINSTLISTAIPVFTLLVGITLRTDRASLHKLIGIALAAVGVVYLIGPARAEFSSSTRSGDLLIILNSFCYGAYIAVSKDLVRRYSALTVTAWIFIVALVATIPAGVVSLSHISLSQVPTVVWLEVLYIILAPTVAAYYLNSWALARAAPSTVAVYIYLQPLIAFALAPLLLGEHLSGHTLVASLLIFAGVLVVTRRGRRQAVQ